jgi:hypothetical protein
LEERQEVKVDIAQEILRFTQNAYSGYKRAGYLMKRHYLAFFWDRFEVKDGVITNSRPSLLFEELIRLELVTSQNAETQNSPDSKGNAEVIIRNGMGA